MTKAERDHLRTVLTDPQLRDLFFEGVSSGGVKSMAATAGALLSLLDQAERAEQLKTLWEEAAVECGKQRQQVDSYMNAASVAEQRAVAAERRCAELEAALTRIVAFDNQDTASGITHRIARIAEEALKGAKA